MELGFDFLGNFPVLWFGKPLLRKQRLSSVNVISNLLNSSANKDLTQPEIFMDKNVIATIFKTYLI
tara:strand:- start:302 stop:499 length:198 start_codon:yes stop_codon:yes gene_type:complete